VRVGYSIYLTTDVSRLRSSSEDDAPWRSTLSCVCCRNIPAVEIRATIVRGAPAFSFGKWMPPRVAEFAWRSLAVLLDSPSTEEFDGQCKHVADTAFGLDDRWCAWIGVQLASQAQHLHIDAAVEDIFVDAGRLQKVFAGERSLRGIEKRNQQRIFALGERDRDSAGITQAPGCADQAARRQIGSGLFPGLAGLLLARVPAGAAPLGCAPEVLSDRRAW